MPLAAQTGSTPALGFRIGKPDPSDAPEVSTVDTRKPARKAPESTGNAAQGVADSILALVSAAGANGAALDQLRDDLFSLGARVESLESVPSSTVRFAYVPHEPGPEVKGAHPALAEIIRRCASPRLRNVFLSGPAGSGKSTIGEHLAQALGRSFGAQSFAADSTTASLIGGPNAHGVYQETAFIRAYESGSVYLLDEIDAAPAEVIVAINAALANGKLYLPRHDNPERRVIVRHPDTIIVCAANTWGMGPNATYVGRSALDAATLNRFAGQKHFVGFDTNRERATLNTRPDLADSLFKIREGTETYKIRRLVTSREFIAAAELAACGLTDSEIIEALLVDWTKEERAKVGK